MPELDRDIADSPVIMDWCRRFPLRWFLADALLAEGEQDETRTYAQADLDAALVTEERTWQVLALELRARLVPQESDLVLAKAMIERALEILKVSSAPWVE